MAGALAGLLHSLAECIRFAGLSWNLGLFVALTGLAAKYAGAPQLVSASPMISSMQIKCARIRPEVLSTAPGGAPKSRQRFIPAGGHGNAPVPSNSIHYSAGRFIECAENQDSGRCAKLNVRNVRLHGCVSSPKEKTMKNKSGVKNPVRTATEISDESFWADASHARDPERSFRITQQIDKAIREHDRNVRRKLPMPNPA